MGDPETALGGFVFALSSAPLWLWDSLATWIRLSFVGKSPVDRSTGNRPRGASAFKIPSLESPGAGEEDPTPDHVRALGFCLSSDGKKYLMAEFSLSTMSDRVGNP